MRITEDDIQELGEKFKDRVRKAVSSTPSGNNNLSEIQDWLREHRIEDPEIVEMFLKKMGPGISAGKKNLHVL